MRFTKRVTMAFLEEDNAQRAFFRLRPLLNDAGPCTQEELSTLPDEGFLRIVPDKNEQTNFKDRMRTLGSLCLIDLTPFPVEANKIRTNKNYAPEKGEKNQYILYSDVILKLPETLVYEVREADGPDGVKEAAAAFLTPTGYVREGDQWYGPMPAQSPENLVTADAPTPACLHTVTFPDGKQRLFYWPLTEGALSHSDMTDAASHPAPEIPVSPQEVPAPNTSRLIGWPAFGQALVHAAPQEDSLAGTPLYAGTVSQARMIKTRNPLHEIVDAKWRAARYDPPSATLSQGVHLRHVENPVEQFKQAAEAVWSIPESQDQALDILLALPGMQKRLETLCRTGEEDSLLTVSMRRQLQEMEAERLSLLMQLDKAKENKAAYREEILNTAQQEQSGKLANLHKEIAGLQETEVLLKAQIAELVQQRAVLQAVCDGLISGELPPRLQAFAAGCGLTAGGTAIPPLRLRPIPGEKAAPEKMIAALQDTLTRKWGPVRQEDAVHFLTLFSLCPRMELSHASLSEAKRFAALCMEALGLSPAFGVQAHPLQRIPADPLPGGMSPLCAATPYIGEAEEEPAFKTLFLSSSPAAYAGHISYQLAPWPVFHVPEAAPECVLDPVPAAGKALPAISGDSLMEYAAGDPVLSKETADWLNEVQKAMGAADHPLPGAVLKTMAAYLGTASRWMQGGIAVAADYAFLSFAAPLALQEEKLLKALKPLLASLPRSDAALRK